MSAREKLLALDVSSLILLGIYNIAMIYLLGQGGMETGIGIGMLIGEVAALITK